MIIGGRKKTWHKDTLILFLNSSQIEDELGNIGEWHEGVGECGSGSLVGLGSGFNGKRR